MTDEEIIQKLSNMDKKLDRIFNLHVRVAKFLHLMPVTEEEERKLQILQRKNLEISAKVNNDLNAMANKPEENTDIPALTDIFSKERTEIYEGIVGDDFLGN